MSNLYEDHVAAFLTLLTAADLTVFDGEILDENGEVPDEVPEQYALVYSYFETPNGLVAADAIPLTGESIELDPRMYVHCVGITAASARSTAAQVRAAVLDVVPVVTGRTGSPIDWREGQPPRRDEDVPGHPVHDQVEVYGWRSLPA